MTKLSPSKTSRQRAERSGRWAEALAAFYLQLQFFRIMARRVKTPVGEIDLIVRRAGLTVFVEVKARGQEREESMALETVNQPRIVRAAHYYLARNPQIAETDMRFDVIFLAPWTWPRHVRDAFQVN